jgi:mono/diheme cytochrome c family protein
MRPHNFRLVLFGALALGFVIWIQAAADTGGNALKGKPIYEKNCLLCHGPQGRGDGPMGKALSPPATNFSSPESMHKTDAELLKVVREGHPDTAMTAWKGSLSEQEFQDLLAYVRQLSRGLEKGKS